MIALLVNVTCIRDDLKNSRNVRSREANLIVRNSRRENSQGNTDLKMERAKIRETRDQNQHEEDYADKLMNPNEIVFDSQPSHMSRLAQKFANDALKSFKMRETINKLVNINSSRNNADTYSLLSVEENFARKSNLKPNHSKSSKHKGRKKKKRRRHRRRRKRLKHRQPRWSKKASAKVGKTPLHSLLSCKVHYRYFYVNLIIQYSENLRVYLFRQITTPKEQRLW